MTDHIVGDYVVVQAHERQGLPVREHIRRIDGSPMTENDYDQFYRTVNPSTYVIDLSKARANMLRGMGLEYKLAEELIRQGGSKARYFTSKPQRRLRHHRKAYYTELAEHHPDDFDEINEMAEKSVANLPKATGRIAFVTENANGSEVYDLIYESAEAPNNEKRVKLSAKTSTMEDKAYRFSTRGWELPEVVEYSRNFLSQSDVEAGRSYTEALERHGMTTRDFQEGVVQQMATSLKDENSGVAKVMQRLTSERFIGSGGYFKNLPNGAVRWYPKQDDTDTVVIDRSTVQSDTVKLFYDADLVDAAGNVKQRYGVSFRVKFKDNPKYPVRVSEVGAPSAVAATIALDLYGNHPIESRKELQKFLQSS